MQAAGLHQAAAPAHDSDSDDVSDEEQYAEGDDWQGEDEEVSPEDERAMAAFMVCAAGAGLAYCYGNEATRLKSRASPRTHEIIYNAEPR